jgi:hypothetical protein
MKLSLPKQFTKCFAGHSSSTIKNLLICSQAILDAQTTNLNKAKDKVGRITGKVETQPLSNYKRLLRFFDCEQKEELVKSLLLVSFYFIRPRRVKYLTLDGTLWEFGSQKIHVLTLCIVYGEVSIPIWWQDLQKRGTSNFEERKQVIEQANNFLDLSGLILLADREYIGIQWFNYLKNKKIDFVIRLKENVYKEYIDLMYPIPNHRELFQKARYIKLKRLADMKRYRRSGVSKVFQMEGHTYNFIVFKNPKKQAEEPLLYFLSSLMDRVKVIKAYPVRWTIECCFKHLKSNGFQMEQIGLKSTAKIKLMIALLVFLYVLCIREGMDQLKKTKDKANSWKKYKNGKKTLSVSIFRMGLSNLILKLHNCIFRPL